MYAPIRGLPAGDPPGRSPLCSGKRGGTGTEGDLPPGRWSGAGRARSRSEQRQPPATFPVRSSAQTPPWRSGSSGSFPPPPPLREPRPGHHTPRGRTTVGASPRGAPQALPGVSAGQAQSPQAPACDPEPPPRKGAPAGAGPEPPLPVRSEAAPGPAPRRGPRSAAPARALPGRGVLPAHGRGGRSPPARGCPRRSRQLSSGSGSGRG